MKKILKVGALIGFVGALAEVGYMSLHAWFGGGSAREVLSSVTYTFFGSEVAWSNTGILLGLAIHLGLGVIMGVAIYSLYLFVTGRFEALKKEGDPAIRFSYIMAYSMVALFAVWAVNFYVILPQVNSHFLQVVPPLLALPSKLSFGLLMGLMLSREAE